MAFAAAVRPLGRAAQHRIYAGHHLFGNEGLGHVIVGPSVQSGQTVADRVSGCQHDYGTAAFLTDQAQQLEAIHIRQIYIEQDQGRRRSLEGFQRSAPVCSEGDLKARLFEVGPKHAGNRFLIFDNQNRFHHI
ncbi:hypothetical protein D3C75_1025610 [compost metagenome]